jgi:hypothetical protein
MRKIFYVLIIFLLSSCAVSIGNAKKYLPEVNKFISEKKVLVFEFGDLDYISENNKYGRVVYEIPEITQNIVQTGTVIGYVQRPANEDNHERWSQLPQFSAGQEDPTYVYFSFGEGVIRVSLQSETSIQNAADYFRDKKLKFIVTN